MVIAYVAGRGILMDEDYRTYGVGKCLSGCEPTAEYWKWRSNRTGEWEVWAREVMYCRYASAEVDFVQAYWIDEGWKDVRDFTGVGAASYYLAGETFEVGDVLPEIGALRMGAVGGCPVLPDLEYRMVLYPKVGDAMR